jgi:ribosomal protein L37AE/L43A
MMKCPNCDADMFFRHLKFYDCHKCGKKYRLEIIESKLVEYEDVISDIIERGSEQDGTSNTETN